MNCCVTDLCEKEIINLKDGCRLGNVSDVEIDTVTGRLTAIIICGKNKLFGLGGRTADIRISWEQIEVIGDDTILVTTDFKREYAQSSQKGAIGSLFREE